MTQAPAVEITDLIRVADLGSGLLDRIRADEVVARLERGGQRRAARIVRALPRSGEWLDPAEVDALMLRVHRELQRLGEELQLPRRVAEELQQTIAPLVDDASRDPVRIVDIGCGLGFVVRWMAAHGALGPDVEYVGVDLDPTLIAEATRLAHLEAVPCSFVHGDAFAPGTAVVEPARTVVISSGLLHHLDRADLADFFAAQQRLGVHAFAHWDIQPSRWTTLGAWVFHAARMREPVARHDGVLSARRAHPAAVLRAAAEAGAPGYEVACEDRATWLPPLTDVLRPITGRRGPVLRRGAP
jgi:SAM-dependent methyltransferase